MAFIMLKKISLLTVPDNFNLDYLWRPPIFVRLKISKISLDKKPAKKYSICLKDNLKGKN